jgi:ABC-type multidrug transport system fused ATPase/permease subunit
MALNKNEKKFKINGMIWDFIKEYKYFILIYSVFMMAFPLELIAQPHYYGKIINNVSNNPVSKLFSANKAHLFAILVIWFVSQILYGSMDMIDGYILPRIQTFIRTNVVSNIIQTYKNNYKELEIGDITAKLVKLPNTIRDLTHQIRNYFLPTAVILTIAVMYLFVINKKLGLIGFIGCIAFVIIVYFGSSTCIERTKEKDRLHNDLTENISDTLNNILPIYSSDTEELELERLNKKETILNREYTRSIFYSLKFKLTYALMYLILFLSINGYAAYLLYKKEIKLDAMISILIIVLYLISMLSATAGEIRDFMFNLGVLEETQVYLDKLINFPKLVETDVSPLNISKGEIVFKNMGFKYPSAEKYLFEDFNLKINSGESIAIMGTIGSGKSTLIKILMKLNRLSRGSILIDGQDLSKVSSNEIRRKISFVPQSPKLFNRTVYENITYGMPNKTKNDVDQLIKKLNLTSIFNSLDDKLETIAGKNGDNLSGGQKQVVFLLRCVLRENNIIILDEPTSALDNENRRFIMTILEDMFKNKTLIIITHDNEIIRHVDRIIDLKQGKLIKDVKTKSV